MPTYDYQCRTCGHRFEVFQGIADEPLNTCPSAECVLDDDRKGRGEVRRLISGGFGLVFKGEGFYLTDYARKKSGASDAKDSGSE